VSWLPVLGFVALGTFFLQKAVRRTAKRTWSWGRGGSGPPLSRRSYAVCGVGFMAIAWVLREAPHPSVSAVAALMLSFVLMLGSGFADSAAARAPRSERETRT